MNRKTNALIKSILDDIKTSDPRRIEEARDSIENVGLVRMLLKSGCPDYIIKAIKETVDLSYYERKYCCAMILQKVKKIPA